MKTLLVVIIAFFRDFFIWLWEHPVLWAKQTIIITVNNWQITLSLFVIVFLAASPFIFFRWKQNHLFSYAAVEICAAFTAMALVLSWENGIFNIASYKVLMTPTHVIALFSGLYFVRGFENLHKSLEQSK